MGSKLECNEGESLQSTLPPIIILNPREKIEADQVPIINFVIPEKDEKRYDAQIVPYPEKPPPEPIPKFPVEMTWNPSTLYFVLDEEPVTLRVRIWNSCKHSMYFNYCGLWGDMARLGASWYCYPHKRIWLPSGMREDILVKATPREIAPIACTISYLQIAAGHMRDNVKGYFSIPIQTKFLKYIPPPGPEGE